MLQVFGGAALTTIKLHNIVMHLPDQAMAHGATAHMMEFWVERMVQLMKRWVKYRSTVYPEILFANTWLFELALARMRRLFPDECKTFDELIPKYQNTPANPQNHDTNRDEQGLQLLGTAKVLSGPELDTTREQLHDIMKLEPDWYDAEMGWQLHCVSDTTSDAYTAHNRGIFTKFARAITYSDDYISSTQCASQRTKDNTWAALRPGAGGNGSQTSVAHMKYFVRVQFDGRNGFPTTQPPQDLKFTVCDIYPLCVEQGPGLRTDMDMENGVVPDLMMAKVSGLVSRDKLVNLADLAFQVVPTAEFTVTGQQRQDKNGTYRYFLTAAKASGRAFGA